MIEPKKVKYIPHDYQSYAIKYIEEHETCAVFLDMGLGKTSITLTAVQHLLAAGAVKKVLVIAPLRVAQATWPDEIAKWNHLAGLSFAVAVGTPKVRETALRMQAQVTIINRENIEWLVKKLGSRFDYDMVVIDELSSFKSWKAKRTRALLSVRPRIRRIVGLTGTPSPNGLMDLFSEFRILDMGKRLGRFIGQYRAAYFTPDKRNGDIIYSYKPLPGAEQRIYDKIADITISMSASDHLPMPRFVSTELSVKLSKKERESYDRFCHDLVLPLKGGEVTAGNAAVLAGKLVQLANGAVYTDAGTIAKIHDRKLDALEDIIEGMNGKPLLVAYWFKHDLERIEKRLVERHILFEEIKSAESIVKWNRGEIAVGLIHPASAGHGLNLQAGGSTLAWFGLCWSLELYQQMNARLYRQGQQHTVVVTHIVTEDTIDEHILAALKQKDKTQAALISAVKAVIA